ncbi:MAG: class I SAM-dependent methyltransferase [Deltaproteobacteria bacterium]|nr:class I SAM-dependent methyltransferase [Deltaproteobacteria bacterium]
MSSQSLTTPDQHAQTSLSFLHDLLGHYHPRNFAVRVWDGTRWEAEPGQSVAFTLVLKHPGALRKMFWPPNGLTLGEAYLHEDFDIEGELEAVFGLADSLIDMHWSESEQLRYGQALLSLPEESNSLTDHQELQVSGTLHSQERDRQAVTYHYNVSNDFYALWLDRRMVYTCAYFASLDEDLDSAQERKLDYICRKLRLRPGERFLDIGCGWGGLIMHAAQHYGVEALGVTLSQPQAELASERIQHAGLANRCRVEVRDYRELDTSAGYDKIASIGMFEHVGESQLPTYFQQAWRLLRVGGVFLNHGIAGSATQPVHNGPSFTDRYVFPDIQVVPISTTLRVAEETGFEVRDVESLREHYMLTMRHWVRRLEAHGEEACRATNKVTYRAWRLFFAAMAHRFCSGRLNLYQALVTKPNQGNSGLPLTRADWYT